MHLGAKELREVGVAVVEWIPGVRGYRSGVQNERWVLRWVVQIRRSRGASV